MRTLYVTAVILMLSACESPELTVPVYQVTAEPFVLEVGAFGEIESAEVKRIMSPGTQPMTLSWLIPENTRVQKGDVVARFDAERLLKDSREQELAMMALQQEIEKGQVKLSQQQREIQSEQTFIGYEFEFTDKFAIEDLRVYSQLEILETTQNRDFLQAKENFLGWKEGSVERQHGSSMDVLAIRKQGHASRFERFNEALSKLQVYAPYDGLLVYEKDRRGEKPTVGQTVFPGRPIAVIPNLDKMQAKLYVLANDAIDLAQGQPVSVRLAAFPEREFSGELKHVSAFPRSIERGNPVKYYELTASLTEQERAIMQPGRKLNAVIEVANDEPTLQIPLQALHYEQGHNYVYLENGRGFKKQAVTTGRKNLYFVEITQGLSQQDKIALSIPALEN